LTVPDPFVKAALAKMPAKNRGIKIPAKVVVTAVGMMRMKKRLNVTR